MKKYTVTGMSCAACSARVEKAVSAVNGVESCNVNLLTNSMSVEGTASEEDIILAVKNAGYGAKRQTSGKKGEGIFSDAETSKLKYRLVWSLVFLLILMYFSMGRMMFSFPAPRIFDNHIFSGFFEMTIAVIVMVIGRKFFISGSKSLFKGAPNMDTLVALGSGMAFLFSFAELMMMIAAARNGNAILIERYGMNLYFESAAMIPTLITVGKLLEAISKGKTTSALKGLMEMAPKTALLYIDGEEKQVAAENVKAGDIFVVKSGSGIPVDGEVVFGRAAVDESMLTGESIPSEKEEGSQVLAGSISRSGYIRCKATKVGEDTTLSAVIKTVADASSSKAPIGRIADKVSGVFVPVVMAISLITFIGWMIAGKDAGFSVTKAITVLVISCPCALGLATPVAIMVGSGVGAKNGILYKTAAALESLGKTKIVALDKTGTITSGEPVVTDVISLLPDEREFLRLACAIEKQSEHPLALAIVKKAGDMALPEAREFKLLAGSGVSGQIDNDIIEGGSYKYISGKTEIKDELKEKINALAEEGKTPILFTKNGMLSGIIAVADTVRDDSANAISSLKRAGIEVVMITGDNEKTASAVSKLAGTDKYYAEVLPDGKADVIMKLKKRGNVAMVGDGINDAPALTVADTGVAIGSGTDIAIDSADVVIIRSRLSDLVNAVKLSRSTVKNIYENLFWAFFYNAICIPLAIGLYGIDMKPSYGAAAMALSSVCVCLNALRLNKIKLSDKGGETPRVSIKEKEKDIMKKTVFVEGMMCEHCEKRVKEALEALDGVFKATPDHNTKKVEIELKTETPDDALKSAIENAGYNVTGIE